MKTLLLCLPLLIISLYTKAQRNPGEKMNEPSFYEEKDLSREELKMEPIQLAGEHLQKYTREYYIGLAMIGGGYTLAGASAVSSFYNRQAGPSAGILVGSLIATGGLVIQFISHRHIGKAGRLLKESTLSENIRFQGSTEGLGIGLASCFYPLFTF